MTRFTGQVLIGPEEGLTFNSQSSRYLVPLPPDPRDTREWQPMRVRVYRWQKFATESGAFSREGWVLERESAS
jgi:hypothetical protein